MAGRPVAAVGAVRRSWLPREASVADEMMFMGGHCRQLTTMSSLPAQPNQMTADSNITAGPTNSFIPPLNLDPVMAGFVSANPNPVIQMMSPNDG